MAELPPVKVKITGDVSGLQKSLGTAQRSVEQFAQGSASKLGTFGNSLAAVGPAGLAAAAALGTLAIAGGKLAGILADATKEAVAYGGQLKDMEAKTGINVEALQKLGFAAKLTGAGLGDVTTAVRFMQRNLVEAGVATSQQAQTFKALGLSVSQLKALAPDQAFLKIAEAIRGIKNPAEQAAAAMDVFGRGGASILPMIKSDAAGAAKELEKLGAVMSGKTAEAADALGDQLDTLEEAWKGMSRALVSGIMESPEVLAFFKELTETVGDLSKWAASHKQDIMDFASGVATLASAAMGAAKSMAALYEPLKRVLDLFTLGQVSNIERIAKGIAGLGGGGGGVAWGGFATGQPATGAHNIPGAWPGLGGGGGGYNPGSGAAGAAAAKAAEAWTKAAEDSRRAWDKFRKDLAGLGDLWDVQKTLNARAREGRLPDINDTIAFRNLAGGPGFMTGMYAGAQGGVPSPAAIKATATWDQQLERLARTMQGLGPITGKFGQALIGLATSIASMGSTLKGGISFKGGIGGILGGIGGMFGLGGAAMGIFGGLKSLFGGKSKEQKAQEAAARQAAIEEQKRQEEERQQKITSGLSSASSALSTLAQGPLAQTQEGFNRLGLYAAATFAGIVKQTGDVVGALMQLAPTLDALIAKQAEMGYEGSAAFEKLKSMYALISGDNAALGQSISALTQLMKGLGDAGMINQTIFAALALDVVALYNALIAKGADANTALVMMQPALQRLWELWKDKGYAIDDATRALLKNAEEQGLVGDSMRDVNQKILDVLVAIADVLGATIPDAYRRLKKEVEGNPIDWGSGPNWGDPSDPSDPRRGRRPGRAAGMVNFQDFGSGTNVVLHGREAVITEDQWRRMGGSDPQILAELRAINAANASLPRILGRAVRDALALAQ